MNFQPIFQQYVYYGSGYRPAAMSAKIVSLKNNRFVSWTQLEKWAKKIKMSFDLILTTNNCKAVKVNNPAGRPGFRKLVLK